MKTLIVGGAAFGSRKFTRKAWARIDYDCQGSGNHKIMDVQFRRPKNPEYEEIHLRYPQYVVGRQGEARYIHLPSYLDRLRWRALTAKIEDEKNE